MSSQESEGQIPRARSQVEDESLASLGGNPGKAVTPHLIERSCHQAVQEVVVVGYAVEHRADKGGFFFHWRLSRGATGYGAPRAMLHLIIKKAERVGFEPTRHLLGCPRDFQSRRFGHSRTSPQPFILYTQCGEFVKKALSDETVSV